MLNQKIGTIIKTLRIEHGLTQKQLADALGITDKAVSKWERGLGAPELSLLADLCGLLKINIETLLEGDLSKSDFVGGNMKTASYYVCPDCHNISICTGTAEIACCGKKLTPLTAVKAEEEQRLQVEATENDWYITSGHPMTKEHYVSFVAFVTGGSIQLIKQYPEWDLDLHIQKYGHGTLLWYCTEHGLFYQLI